MHQPEQGALDFSDSFNFRQLIHKMNNGDAARIQHGIGRYRTLSVQICLLHDGEFQEITRKKP